MRVNHTLEPIYSKESKTLILGSMPSVASRNIGKYYGHKTNRFWPVMYAIYEEEPNMDWRDFIIKHKLALWDVIESCEIDASSDSSIKNVRPNDIASLLEKTEIENIFILGQKAYDLYNKHIKEHVNIEAKVLPSTSSANASYSLEDLIKEYSIIRKITEKREI